MSILYARVYVCVRADALIVCYRIARSLTIVYGGVFLEKLGNVFFEVSMCSVCAYT